MFSQNNLETLTLEDLLKMAEEQSIAGAAAQLDKQEAQLNYSIFKAGLKPQLSGNANFPNFANTFAEAQQPDGTILFPRINNNNSALGLELTQQIGLTGGFAFIQSDLQRFDDFTNDKTSYNGTPFRVGFYQPLFGFNQVKWDKKIEPLKLQEAEKKYAADMETIHIEAVDLFFNLLNAYENLQIAISNQTNNKKLFSIAEEKFELGKISKSDVLQLQLELLSSNQNKKRAEQSVRNASALIYTFLGKKHDGQLISPETPQATTPINTDLTIALQQSNANRFEQYAFLRQLAEADQDVEQAKKDGGLQANLTASFGLSRGADNVSDIYADPQQQQFVQLQLSVPILDWGRQKSLVGIAKARQSFLEKKIQQDRLQQQAEIRQTIDAFNTWQEELQLADEMKKLAQQRFDITRQSYVLGSISITELTLAQREKDQALRQHIFTLTQYWKNYYLLRALTIYDFEKQEKIIWQ